jgi:hypothetical protein
MSLRGFELYFKFRRTSFGIYCAFPYSIAPVFNTRESSIFDDKGSLGVAKVRGGGKSASGRRRVISYLSISFIFHADIFVGFVLCHHLLRCSEIISGSLTS